MVHEWTIQVRVSSDNGMAVNLRANKSIMHEPVSVVCSPCDPRQDGVESQPHRPQQHSLGRKQRNKEVR